MLIPPEAFVLDCWNLLILLLVLVQSVTIPLEAAYDLEPVLGPVIERVVWSLFVQARNPWRRLVVVARRRCGFCVLSRQQYRQSQT